jgi:pyruvate dehydrogenase E1 component
MLHPDQPAKRCYLEEVFSGVQGPFIAASDYLRMWSEQINPWVPGGLFALGTEGFGRSDNRESLRRHFEVDAESVVVGTLYRLAQLGQFDRAAVAGAIRDLGIDPEKIDPAIA